MPSPAHALALAMLVLLSATAGLAGGQPPDADVAEATRIPSVEAAGVTPQASTPTVTLASGGSFWQGQRLRLDASSLLEGSSNGRTFEVWQVTDGGRLNRQLGSFSVGEGGEHVLDTSAYEGRVVLRYAGQPVYVHQGQAYLESPPDGAAVTVGSSAFRLARQTLSFEWSDPSAFPGQRVTLTVESNRAASVVAVSGANFTYQNLTAIFPESAYASDHGARANDSALLLDVGGRTEILLDTDEMKPGERTLQFDVVDTTTVASTTLTVHEPSSDSRFNAIERREHVGDVIETNLSCGHCYLIVGGPGQGLLDVVELRDSNGDGTVGLDVNTRYMGMMTSTAGHPSGVQPYTSPQDEVERYSASDELQAVADKLITDTSSLGDRRGQLDLRPRGRLKPVTPGEVRLTVASSDFVIHRSNWGDQAPYGSDLVVRDETDVRTVTLEPRSLDGIEAVAAPGGGAYEGTATQLRAETGPRDPVALGDRLVFRVDVSGVHGYLAANDVGVDELVADQGEGISLALDRVGDGGTESILLPRKASTIVPDPDGDALYLVIRTGEGSPNWLKGGEYRATFELEGVNGKFAEYSTKRGFNGYPYLPPGEREAVSTNGRLADTSATIATPETGTSPRLTSNLTLAVEGTTNAAGGSSLTVIVNSTEFAWRSSERTLVRADGSWASVHDLSEAPGDGFEVMVTREGNQLAVAEYTVRPPAEDGGNATDGGGSNDGGEAGGGGGVVGGDSGGLLGSLTSLAKPVGAGVGGLVVLWGTWRLLIRRIIFS